MVSYYDPGSGLKIALATALANPSGFKYYDPWSGSVLALATVLANPAMYGYLDPDHGGILKASDVLSGGSPVLGTPVLSGTLTQGVPVSGVTLLGLTDGSTVDFNIAGLSISTVGTTRTVSGTPASAGQLNVTETLAGAIGSPKTTNNIGTVSGAAATTSLSATAPTTGIDLLSANGRNAQMGGRWIQGPALTQPFGNGTTAAAGALAIRVRFKPGEHTATPNNSGTTAIIPIYATGNGLTGGGTQSLQFVDMQNTGAIPGTSFTNVPGCFVAIFKDVTQSTAALVSAPITPAMLTNDGVLSVTLAVRRDNSTGAFTLDMWDTQGNKYAGSPVTPSTWVGYTTTGNLKIGQVQTTPPALAYGSWAPIAVSDFLQLTTAGTDTEWANFVTGVATPAALWSTNLAAHFALRSPTDLAQTAGFKTYAACSLQVTGAGLPPHGQINMGKFARSSDGTKGLAWTPTYQGFVHALTPTVVRACTSLNDLRAAAGDVVRDVTVAGAATHLQMRAARRSDGVVVKDWTRVTSSPVTGQTTVVLPGVPVGAQELILELRREDDPSFVAQCAEDDRVGCVVVLGPSQSQFSYMTYGGSSGPAGQQTTDPYTLAPSVSSTVSFLMNRQQAKTSFLPVDGGYMRTNGLCGSGMVAIANYWDSLNTNVPLELVSLSIPGSATVHWMYHRNTTSDGPQTPTVDYFGDSVTPTSGYSTQTLLAKRKRVTAYLHDWATADRSTSANGGTFATFGTIYGNITPTELAWPARWNELMGGVPKAGASPTELSQRSNFTSLTAWQPWTIGMAVGRENSGNITTPTGTGAETITAQRLQQYAYFKNGTGRDPVVIASYGGEHIDHRMDSEDTPHFHMTDPMGAINFGLNCGRALAYVFKASTINNEPKFETATGAGTNVLTLPATLVNGGALMVGVNGATITGFDVSIDGGSTWSYYDGSVAFTAALSGNSITLTKASGTWPTGGQTKVRYLSGYPVSRSTVTGSNGDPLGNIQGMLYESRADALPGTIAAYAAAQSAPLSTSMPAGVPILPTFTPLTAV